MLSFPNTQIEKCDIIKIRKEAVYLSIIGQRIRKHRMNKGLTQEELGDLLGVQKSAVQKYENGSISLKGETIKKLCEIFSVLPYELIWEDHVDRAEAIVDILKRNEELKQKSLNMLRTLPRFLSTRFKMVQDGFKMSKRS